MEKVERADLIRTLVRRTHTYNKLADVGYAPDALLDDVKKLLDSALKQLRDVGIDGKAYLRSPKGQVALLVYEQEMKVNDASGERCGRCLHYGMIDIDDENDDHTCGKGMDGLPEICRLFEDSGEEFVVRLQAGLHRCSGCRHCKVTRVKRGEYHFDQPSCVKRLSKLQGTCSSFEASLTAPCGDSLQ